METVKKVGVFATCLSVLFLSSLSFTQSDKGDANEKWISLFNGKNLDNWIPKIAGYDLGENPGRIFRVENGVLKVSYDHYKQFGGRFGHLFYKNKLSNYRLRLEYRFVGKQAAGAPRWAYRNNGVMIHCQSPESMRKDQKFPVCLEAQLLGGDGKHKRPTGNLYTPGTFAYIDGKKITESRKSSSKTYHGDQWVKFEVEVHGHRQIIYRVNGREVLRYEKPFTDDGKPLKEGYLALQAESHGTEFRNIQLLKLDE